MARKTVTQSSEAYCKPKKKRENNHHPSIQSNKAYPSSSREKDGRIYPSSFLLIMKTLLHVLLLLQAPFAWPFSAVSGKSSLLESDKEAVRQQLGYLPPNFLAVSARNINGAPVAIQAYPLDGGAPRRQAKAARSLSESTFVGTPFPTLYWLTCPAISKAIAEMERNGYVGVLENRLKEDPAAVDRLFRCHKEYARERWECLSEEDRNRLTLTDSSSIQRMRGMLETSGIAGTNTTSLQQDGSLLPSIKCLHAHYADFRSTSSGADRTENPVGRMVHDLLVGEFPSVRL